MVDKCVVAWISIAKVYRNTSIIKDLYTILPWICVWFHSDWVDRIPGTSPADCWLPRLGRIRQTTSRPESERSKEYRTNKAYCASSTKAFTGMLVKLVDVFVWISTHKWTKKIIHYTVVYRLHVRFSRIQLTYFRSGIIHDWQLRSDRLGNWAAVWELIGYN